MIADRRAGAGRAALEREFIDLVGAAIERGDMSIERATDFMLEHGIRPPVVQGVIERAQRPTEEHAIQALEDMQWV
ncbi:MAG TPA: hypothetical protein PLN31_17270 [Azoarcus taiwanensis]|nr:hypothetical protein [Azoarcus taiwanensis]